MGGNVSRSVDRSDKGDCNSFNYTKAKSYVIEMYSNSAYFAP